MKNFFFLCLGLTIIIGSIVLFWNQPLSQNGEIKEFKINNTVIRAEIVDTPEKKERGLSGRKVLPEGTGMLFVFEKPDIYSFWMKDMNFSIDIVWIDENFVVVDIDKKISPDTFPQHFSPSQKIKYVLELPSGFTEKYRIDIGAVLQ